MLLGFSQQFCLWLLQLNSRCTCEPKSCKDPKIPSFSFLSVCYRQIHSSLLTFFSGVVMSFAILAGLSGRTRKQHAPVLSGTSITSYAMVARCADQLGEGQSVWLGCTYISKSKKHRGNPKREGKRSFFCFILS